MKSFNRMAAAISSATGGTGVSSLSKELAVYFAAAQYEGEALSVCLVEMNMSFGAQTALFKIAPAKTLADLLQKVKSFRPDNTNRKIDSFLWEEIEEYITKQETSGVYLLPAPVVGTNEYSLSEIELLALNKTLKEHFDIVIYDTRSGTEDLTLKTMAIADICFLVVTDNRNSFYHTQKMRMALREAGLDMDRLRVILNAYPKKAADRLNPVSDIRLKVYMDHLFIVPEEPNVWISNNLFNPMILVKGKSAYKTAIQSIAEGILPGTVL